MYNRGAMTYVPGGGADPPLSPTTPLMCCVFNCARAGDTPIAHTNRALVATCHANRRTAHSSQYSFSVYFGKTVRQSAFMLTMVQPLALASSSAASSLPIEDARS